jgi:prepilin-type N-terminal cleavage/methylation domain-containing protein/prepilin-type processing-associated H-X9-DG protein
MFFRHRSAFTLIELLVVIAIIAVLIGLLLPAVQKVRSAAARAACANNLKQLALACHNYHDVEKSFPAGLEMSRGRYTVATFFVRLLPYVEQDALYRQWDFVNPANNSATRTSPAATVVKTFICPADLVNENPVFAAADPNASNIGSVGSTVVYEGWFSLTSYAGNFGNRNFHAITASTQGAGKLAKGIFFETGKDIPQKVKEPHMQTPRSVTREEVLDGLTRTILIGEQSHTDERKVFDLGANSDTKLANWGKWGWTGYTKGSGHVTRGAGEVFNLRLPTRAEAGAGSGCPNSELSVCQDRYLNSFASDHVGGVNFAFCDGSVQFVRDTIPTQTRGFLCLRDDGKLFDETSY